MNQTTDTVKNDLANLISSRKKVEVDLSKIVVGARVRHKAFGEGVIKEIETGKPYIHVLFDTGIEKPFVIPMAFAEGFLTLLENDLSKMESLAEDHKVFCLFDWKKKKKKWRKL